MDPLTQITVGAVVASVFAKRCDLRLASICGAIAGAAPDIDVLIRSSSDSLLFIDYHRHFTHSLFFIPFGSLIVSSLIYFLNRKQNFFSKIFFYCFLGFSTHGILDACTTYGTMLYFPFSNERVAWNIISIIDPIFTATLLIAILFSISRMSKIPVYIGTIACIYYLSLGVVQRENVKSYVEEIANKRGHSIEKILVSPTIGNIILWRTIYKYDGFYYVDAVHMPFFKNKSYKDGNFAAVINENIIYKQIPANSVMRKDIKRFSKFSNGFIYLHPDYNNVIGDLRYGTLPYDSKSLWGIKVNKNNPDTHAEYVSLRNFSKSDWNMFRVYLLDGF